MFENNQKMHAFLSTTLLEDLVFLQFVTEFLITLFEAFLKRKKIVLNKALQI
jgi:hypothetical protein